MRSRLVIGQSGWVHLVEGAIGVTVFVGYIWAIGRIPEIARVFQYHGAEHMTIHAYECRRPTLIWTVGQLPQRDSRCGTSFLLLVVLLSVLVFSLWDDLRLPWLIASRVLLIPVIGVHEWSGLLRSGRMGGARKQFLLPPGSAGRGSLTRVPEEPMIPVAVASLLAALDRSTGRSRAAR